MTQYEQRQVQQTAVFYGEDHSAIRWPYYFHMVFWGIVLTAACVETAVTGNPNWSVPLGLIYPIVLFAVLFTIVNWPVGIRVGGDGIRIGAVRRAPEPPGKQPWADNQRWHVLFAPWDAVLRVAVITDKPGLRDARMLRRRNINGVGVLTAPFTRAVLLIEVDPARVVLPDFREPDEKLPFWRPGHMTPFELSPVWYVPTRRPEALRAVLAQHAALVGGTSSPELPAYLRLLFERASA